MLTTQSRAVSLWDMLEVNAQSFMNSVMELRRIQSVIDHVIAEDHKSQAISDEAKTILIISVGTLITSIASLPAGITLIAAQRLSDGLTRNIAITWSELRNEISNLESRLRDELGLVKLFMLDRNESMFLSAGRFLMGDAISENFPAVLFEMEEASRCQAFGRATASAFHAMRALEVAVRALAKFLEIDDPTKPSDRNWGVVLRAIKTKMDEKYPSKERIPFSDGAEVEALYASLDAVKNPWRNSTMHTENVYQPYEAAHIIQAVNAFLLRMSGFIDQEGQKVTNSSGSLALGGS